MLQILFWEYVAEAKKPIRNIEKNIDKHKLGPKILRKLQK